MDSNTEVFTKSKSTQGLALQDYLSVGNVFLLVLGVFHETIYYNFLGVNILEYSSVLDVLISPLAVMFGNLFLGLAVVVVVILSYVYLRLMPRYYRWLETKKRYQQGRNKLKLEKAKQMVKHKNGPLVLISIYVFMLFIGLGIGRGQKTKEIIGSEKVELSHIITFDRGGKLKVNLMGKNSLYVFYVTGGKEEVSIAPIQGNIRLIQKINNE